MGSQTEQAILPLVPMNTFTREQACTMLARYCEQYGIALAERNQVQTYRDDSSISLW